MHPVWLESRDTGENPDLEDLQDRPVSTDVTVSTELTEPPVWTGATEPTERRENPATLVHLV